MPFVMGVAVPFCVYWLILFVGCYIVVEYGQTYLYDEATPSAALKVAIGTLLFAAILTWARTSYETMFTQDLWRTVLQAVVWFLVFTLVFRFHPWHALGIGLVALVILAGTSTLAINSFTGVHPTGVASEREPRKPLRKALAPTPPVGVKDAKPAEDKSATPAKKAG